MPPARHHHHGEEGPKNAYPMRRTMAVIVTVVNLPLPLRTSFSLLLGQWGIRSPLTAVRCGNGPGCEGGASGLVLCTSWLVSCLQFIAASHLTRLQRQEQRHNSVHSSVLDVELPTGILCTRAEG
jgi:hypothetical protein